MALIKCTECGAEISDKATACPKCGCPVRLNPVAVSMGIDDNGVLSIPKKKRRKWLWVFLVALVVAGVTSAAWFILYPQDSASVFARKKQDPQVKITPEFCNAIRKYNELSEFNEGFAAVKNGDKWGFINTEGKEVVPCKYEKVGIFKNGFAIVKNGEKWGVVNTASQEVIPCKYDDVSLGENGLVSVEIGNKCGFVNTEGKEIVPCKYDNSRNFHDGLAAVLKNGRWGFISTEGKEVIPFKFDKEQGSGPSFSQGLAFIYVDTNGDGYMENCFIDKNGEVRLKLPEKYHIHYGSEPEFNEDKVCPVEVGNDNYVWIDMQGQEVKGYKEPEGPYDTYQLSKNLELEGIMDKKTGKYIIPAKYSYISSEFHNGVALAELKYTKISSGPSGYNEETVRIYGYVDIEGNETFTSDDFITVRQENNKATLEKSRIEHEAEQPQWLQGEWFFRSSNGTCYARIEGDNILVAFGQDVSYNGPYTIEDDKVIYDRHDGMYCYLPFDRNREVLMMDENNQMYRSADEANNACRTYDSRSSSSGIYSGQNTHPFENDGDVLDFTSGTFYNSEGTRLSLKYNGMYVNGVNTQTTSTVVTSFSGMYARVKVNVIPNGVWTFTVDKANGTLTDMEGGVWRKK